MKAAASIIGLPRYDHRLLFPALKGLGLEGVEVAPGWAWEDPWAAADVDAYRRSAEGAGLQVVGLHRLLDGCPHLSLLGDGEVRRATVDALARLSALCRDLGGRTLVLGAAGRRRGAMPVKAAWLALRACAEELLPRIEPHGTVLCLDPLGPGEGDFCTLARECRLLTDALEHPALGLQMNSKAQMENDDRGHVPFHAVRGRLDLFTVSEPGYVVAGTSGLVDHEDVRRHLRTIRYDGWVSLTQRVTAAPLAGLACGVDFVRSHYFQGESRRHMLTRVVERP